MADELIGRVLRADNPMTERQIQQLKDAFRAHFRQKVAVWAHYDGQDYEIANNVVIESMEERTK